MTEEEYIQQLRILHMTVGLDDLTTDLVNEMRGTLNKSLGGLLNKTFNKTDLEDYERGRAEKLLREFRAGLDVIAEATTGKVSDLVVMATGLSQSSMNKILSWDGRVKDFKNVGFALDDIKAGVMTTEINGGNLNKWIGQTFDDSLSAIREELNAGRVLGETYEDIAGRVRKKLKNDLFATTADGSLYMKNGRPVRLSPNHELETITRSFVQTANVNAQSAAYAANDDIVSGVEWVATLENGNFSTGQGTCPRCAALDGQSWKIDKAGQARGGPPCPLHPRCRCILAPKTPTWRELGFDIDEMSDVYRPYTIRAEAAVGLGGNRQILEVGTGGKNYESFFNSRDALFQDTVVGPVRADMIRNNFFSLNDIVDKRGDLIPIRDLRAKYNIPGTGQGPVAKVIPPPAAVIPKSTKKTPVIVPKENIAPEWYDTLGVDPSTLGYTWIKIGAKTATARQKKAIENILQIQDFKVIQDTVKPNGELHGAYQEMGGRRNSRLNMPSALQAKPRAARTFLHETGHFYDHQMYYVLPESIRGPVSTADYAQMVSNSKVYSDAMFKDERRMKGLAQKDYKKLTPKGSIFTKDKYQTEIGKARGSMLDKMRDENPLVAKHPKYSPDYLKEMLAAMENHLENKVKPELAGLWEMTKNLKGFHVRTEGDSQYFHAVWSLLTASELNVNAILLETWMPSVASINAYESGQSNIHALMDMIGGTTKEKYGSGHGVAYYNDGGWKRQAQSFAQMFLTFDDPESQTFLKYFVPEQKKAFQKLIDGGLFDAIQ